jgi:hypothetical protein
VDTEEREGRVRHWIDQVSHQLSNFFAQDEIFSAERQNAQVEVLDGLASQSVGVQASAGDDMAGIETLTLGDHVHVTASFMDTRDTVFEKHASAELLHLRSHRLGYRAVINDACLRYEHASNTGAVRLTFPNFVSAQSLESVEPVGSTSAPEFVELCDLFGFGGHDNLPANFVRHAMLTAKLE